MRSDGKRVGGWAKVAPTPKSRQPCHRLMWRPALTLSLMQTDSWFARARMPSGLHLKMYTMAHSRGFGGGSGVYMPVFAADDSELPARDWLALGGGGDETCAAPAHDDGDSDSSEALLLPTHGSLRIRLRPVSMLRHILASELPRWFREQAGVGEAALDELKVLLRPAELAISLAAYALLLVQVLLVQGMDGADATGSGVGVGVGTDGGGLALSPAMLTLRLACAVTALLHLEDGGGGGSGGGGGGARGGGGDLGDRAATATATATAVGGGASTVVMVWAMLAVATELWKLVRTVRRGSAGRSARAAAAAGQGVRGDEAAAAGKGAAVAAAASRGAANHGTDQRQLQLEHAAAARLMVALLAPAAAGLALRSLLLVPQRSWYSWGIASLAETLYICGISLMLPPVVRNCQLGTVPPPRRPPARNRRLLAYRIACALSDDVVLLLAQTHSTGLPTAHALACLRDDVVLLVELAQSYGPLRLPIDDARRAEVE